MTFTVVGALVRALVWHLSVLYPATMSIRCALDLTIHGPAQTAQTARRLLVFWTCVCLTRAVTPFISIPWGCWSTAPLGLEVQLMALLWLLSPGARGWERVLHGALRHLSELPIVAYMGVTTETALSSPVVSTAIHVVRHACSSALAAGLPLVLAAGGAALCRGADSGYRVWLRLQSQVCRVRAAVDAALGAAAMAMDTHHHNTDATPSTKPPQCDNPSPPPPHVKKPRVPRGSRAGAPATAPAAAAPAAGTGAAAVFSTAASVEGSSGVLHAAHED